MMVDGIKKVIVDLTVTFVIRQVAKYASAVDFEKIKADVEPRIRDLVPGEWMDDAVVDLMKVTVDALAEFVKEHLEEILTLLKEGKYSEALDKLLEALVPGKAE
jgi:hypothetical protein